MLANRDTQAAADLHFENWREGNQLSALPEALRPSNRAQGYAIQAHFEQRSERPLFGWKIAATSEGGQRHIGVDGPLAGRLLAERVLQPGEERHSKPTTWLSPSRNSRFGWGRHSSHVENLMIETR